MTRLMAKACLVLVLAAGVLPGGPTTVRAADPDTGLPAGQALDKAPAADPLAIPDGTGSLPGGTTCDHPTDRLLVRFTTPSSGKARPAYKAIKGKRLRTFNAVPGLELVKTANGATQAAKALRKDPSVVYAEPDCTITLDAVPDDPALGQQWGLVNTGQGGGTPGADIGAAEAWDVRTDASSVTVAVIDTGIDTAHPDLAANVWTNPGEVAGNGIDDDGNGFVDDIHGWDFVGQDATPDTDNAHGTHVAGTIGAVGDNGVGVTGVAWNVRLMALQAFDAGGSAQLSTIVAAIDYALANGARIINSSFGSGDFSRSLYDAYVAAGEAGILTVAAAGNNAQNADESPHYPAAFRLDTVISVAATTRHDGLASFSNYGVYNVHVAAPGEEIHSTLPGGAYGLFSGTSMATPHVAGVAALILAEHPGWTPQEVRDRILGTVRHVAGLVGDTWTGGVVDAGAALSGAPTVLPPDPAPSPETLAASVVPAPNPPPATPPAPPVLSTPELVDASPADIGAPEIAVDAEGTPFVAYTRRFDGVHVASRAGDEWTDQQLSSVYDDFYWLGLAVAPDGVPKVAVQRSWSDLGVYSDPGVVVLEGGAAPSSTRVTASCPHAGSCSWDWTPAIATDAAGASHVVFSRADPFDQDMVKAPNGSVPSVPGSGLYYATDAGGSWEVTRLFEGGNGGIPTIAVAADGAAHIVVQRRAGSASGLYYLTNEGGTWSSLRLTDDVQDTSPSLAVDGSGGLRLVYARAGIGVFYRQRTPNHHWNSVERVYDGSAYRARVAINGPSGVHVAIGLVDGMNTVAGVIHATNATGSWVTTPVAGGQAAYPSIAVDDAGIASIAYLQFTTAPIGLYVANDATGSFVSDLVREVNIQDGSTNLAHVVDAGGHSHVAVGRGYAGSAPGVWYGTDTTGSWVFERVVAGYPTSVSITLDSTGAPLIAFLQQQLLAGSNRVGYARRSGASWTVETVSTDLSGDGVSIALDPAGVPNVVWADAQATRLLRGKRVSGAWVVDQAYAGAATNVRSPVALVDPSGVVHVAFVAFFPNEEGARLMYARRGTSWTSATVAAGGVLHWYPSIARTTAGALWIADWQEKAGVWAYTSTGGGWTATQVASGAADTYPSVTVDASGRVRVAYGSGFFYSSSGCSVPMCPGGPGLREAVRDGGTWATTKLTAYWHDTLARAATGADGTVRLVFSRTALGLRSLTTVEGVDTTGPTVIISRPPSPTNATTLAYGVTFNEPVTGLAASDFTRTGTATGCVVGAPSGSGASYTVQVTGCGSGTVVLGLKAGSVTDAALNAGPVVAAAASSVTVDRAAPSVTTPYATFRTKTTLDGTSLRMSVAWSGSDSGSGVASYEIARSEDGGTTWSSLSPTVTDTSFSTTVPSSGTVRFRVRATDKAGNTGAWSTGPVLTPRLVQETSGSVTRSGTWASASSTSYSGGTLRYAATAGKSVTYSFTGRAVAWVAFKGPSRGSAKVYIDGSLISTVSLYSTTKTARAVVFQRRWSSVGAHKVRIVVVGTSGHGRVDVDAFAVLK